MNHEEYVRLVMKIGNQKAQEYGPVLVMGGWQFSREKCPGLTDEGCILPYEYRPEACRIYPFVKIPTTQGDRVFLDVSRCKHWRTFGEDYPEVSRHVQR